MSRPLWFHDGIRKHIFCLKDGQFTHCYRVEYEVNSCHYANNWWQVPIPKHPWSRDLGLVRLDCEILHQIYLLIEKGLPPAGMFMKIRYKRDPRFNQWGELISREQKPDYWGRSAPLPFDDFVPSPHFSVEDEDLFG